LSEISLGTWETHGGNVADVQYFVDAFQAWFGMIDGEIPGVWNVDGTACKPEWNLKIKKD
jgi:hypothetical protein